MQIAQIISFVFITHRQSPCFLIFLEVSIMAVFRKVNIRIIFSCYKWDKYEKMAFRHEWLSKREKAADKR